MQKIYTVDALCGSGKTYQAIRYAVKQAKLGEKVVIVQPSKDLIDQSFNDCCEVAAGLVPVRKYHSGTCEDNGVKGGILRHLKETDSGGEVLFITHAAFLSMPYWHKAAEWNVIFDEIPVVDRDFTENVPDTHEMVTSLITTVGDEPIYYRLVPDDTKRLRAMAENRKGDAVFSVFRDISEALVSEHWDVYALKQNWHRMKDGVGKGDQIKLPSFGLLRPTIFERFKSVCIMGAMLTDSVMYHWWLGHDVKFVSHPVIETKVRERLAEHGNGEHLTIHYLSEEPYSKNMRDKIPGGLKVFAQRNIQNVFGTEPFIWVANNDVDDTVMDAFPDAKRVSNSPHGLNQFQHIHNVIFLSALNASPAHFGFMKSKGVDGTDLRNAMVHQITYQAVMRSSLRDPANTEPKKVLVSDKQTAEWLASHFGGCSVGKTDEPLKVTKKKAGRPAIGDSAMSSAERVRRHREHKKRQLRCNENAIRDRDFVTVFGSLFGSIYARQGEVLNEVADSDDFIEQLHECHQQSFDAKNKNGLISPAVFDPDVSEDTSRGLENITHLWGVWLDNDGGDLPWQEFQRTFPDLKMVCMNTWSGKDRYRVFIPTTAPMTLECHQLVVHYMIKQLNGYFDDQTADKLAKYGKSVKRHGFDMSKLVPSSLFYMPCQAADPQDSFFNGFDGEPLDPFQWGSASIDMSKPDATPPQFEPLNDNRAATDEGSIKIQRLREQLKEEDVGFQIERAKQVYCDTPTNMKMRNRAFFKLGLKLKTLGLDEVEIRQHLVDADYDSSRSNKSAIDGVTKSLRNRKYG